MKLEGNLVTKLTRSFKSKKNGRKVDKELITTFSIMLIEISFFRNNFFREIEKLIEKRLESQNGIVLMNL